MNFRVTLTCEIFDVPMDEVKPQRRWTQRKDSDRAQQAEITRQALIVAARELFAEHGYHAVGVRDVTARAGVTRGALGHHFAGKEDLFLAVFDAVERDLITGDPDQADPTSGLDAWSRFRQGVQHYLDAVMRKDVQRITLIDGPAVLGWPRWRALEETYSLGSLTMVLGAAMDQGLIRKRPIEPLAHMVLGSVMEAALLIAHSDDPQRRRKEVGEALDDLLCGLK
jgi:AcrR family transcriptional regulator